MAFGPGGRDIRKPHYSAAGRPEHMDQRAAIAVDRNKATAFLGRRAQQRDVARIGGAVRPSGLRIAALGCPPIGQSPAGAAIDQDDRLAAGRTGTADDPVRLADAAPSFSVPR
jgi:hypothetical protein